MYNHLKQSAFFFAGDVFGRVNGITRNMSQMKNSMSRFFHWNGNLNACINCTEALKYYCNRL